MADEKNKLNKARGFEKTKGATDYFPEEKQIQETVFASFKDTAKSYGFSMVEPPVIESLSLLSAKSGPEIKEQIFTLDKRSKEELGLRFEYTAGAARMLVNRQKALQKPVRWFSIGRVWRYERPQAGRDREFYQFNAEIYGSGNPEADAEVISLAIDSLKSTGLSEKDFIVKINSRKLLFGLLSGIVKENQIEDVIRVIDKKAKIPPQEFEQELGFLKKEQLKKICCLLELGFEELKPKNMNNAAKEGYYELKEIFSYLQKKCIIFDICTVRGLAYYTGTVFEIFDSKGKFRSLCGGGRYDKMIEIFGGQSMPATGFGIGYSTVYLLLKEKNLVPAPDFSVDYFVAVADESARADAVRIASELRKNNSVLMDLMRRSLAKQLKYADSIGARKVVFVGPDELKAKKAKVKDMASGKESYIPIKNPQ